RIGIFSERLHQRVFNIGPPSERLQREPHLRANAQLKALRKRLLEFRKNRRVVAQAAKLETASQMRVDGVFAGRLCETRSSAKHHDGAPSREGSAAHDFPTQQSAHR